MMVLLLKALAKPIKNRNDKLVASLFSAGQGAGGGDHAAAGHPRKNALHQTEPLPGCQQHPQHTQFH